MNTTIESFPQCKEIIQNSAGRAEQLLKTVQRDILPLERELPPTRPYPFDALGSILGDAARRTFEVVQAPDGVVGNSFLAAAALAAQRSDV